MKVVYLLAVLVVAGYGIAWMIGGPQLANRFARWTGRALWLATRWLVGAVFRFSGWVLREFGMAGGNLLGRAGRRISP